MVLEDLFIFFIMAPFTLRDDLVTLVRNSMSKEADLSVSIELGFIFLAARNMMWVMKEMCQGGSERERRPCGKAKLFLNACSFRLDPSSDSPSPLPGPIYRPTAENHRHQCLRRF